MDRRLPEGVSLAFVDLMACAFLGLVILLVVTMAGGATGGGESLPFELVTLRCHYSAGAPDGDVEVRLNGRPVLLVEKGHAAFALTATGRRSLQEDVAGQPFVLDLHLDGRDPRPGVSLTSIPPEPASWEWNVLVLFKDGVEAQKLEFVFSGDPAARPARVEVSAMGPDGHVLRKPAVDLPADDRPRRLTLLVGDGVQVKPPAAEK